MEENNNYQESEKNTGIEKHCGKQCLAMVLASFLGGFLAFYFVMDQMMERQYRTPKFHPDRFEKRMFDDMDRMYRQDMKAFDDMFKKMPNRKMMKEKNPDLNMPLFMMDSVKIKTEYEDNQFNIIIGLKPFQDDENKVNYAVQGRKLTVFGNSQVKDKNYVNDISFSQDFILPENADIANISKTKDGHKLIISVPVK